MTRQEEIPVLRRRTARAKTKKRLRLPAVVSAVAGPGLIVASVLVALNRFLAGRLFPLRVDLRAQWLPYF